MSPADLRQRSRSWTVLVPVAPALALALGAPTLNITAGAAGVVWLAAVAGGGRRAALS